MKAFRMNVVAAVFASAMTYPYAGHAAGESDLKALRAEIAEMRQAYEQRIATLEQRLARAERDSSEAKNVASAAVPPAVAGNKGSNFNPDVSLILQGRYHNAEGDGHITGFLPSGHGHGDEKGLLLDHTELTIGANIDPDFRGYANFAVADGSVETEEAWVQTTSLGNGFSAKAGRYLSGIGYTNELHPHAWDFANQNLAYSAMLGEHYGQDGIQLKWVAPTSMFLEFGAEAGQGANWSNRNQLGSHALFAHIGDDFGVSNSWRAGLSYLRTRNDGREGHWDDDAGEEAETLYSGLSKFWIADFVWKWAPNGNATQQNFKFQSEYLRRQESGDLTCADNSVAGGACPVGDITDTYSARQSGWYAQGVYQFMPQWRVGYRYDRLDLGSVSFGGGFAGVLSKPDFTPERHSIMFDWNPSEFSRLRLQFARDEAEQGLRDNQVTLQYIHSLGPHGAHKF